LLLLLLLLLRRGAATAAAAAVAHLCCFVRALPGLPMCALARSLTLARSLVLASHYLLLAALAQTSPQANKSSNRVCWMH
jgi:hypothetical protein